MELPQLGQQCSAPHCKQLDFLVLQCKCGGIYCKEHFREHVQTCEPSRQLSEDELRKILDVYVCSEEGCRTTDVVELLCRVCKKHYCIKHRHIDCNGLDAEGLAREKERYAKPVREFNKAKEVVDKEIEQKLAKTVKNRQLANKVQLMKIKSKALGVKSIPVADRVYFNVQLPEKYSFKLVPVFVSRTWTIGRIIDAIASEAKIENNNNKSNEKKLRLFLKGSEETAFEVAESLANLLQSQAILDGDNLVIEYV